MLPRRAGLLLFGVLSTLLFSRDRVRLVEPLCRILLPQLGILCCQLCIVANLVFYLSRSSIRSIKRATVASNCTTSAARSSIARLWKCSVHTRCLSDSPILQHPCFRGEMDSYFMTTNCGLPPSVMVVGTGGSGIQILAQLLLQDCIL